MGIKADLISLAEDAGIESPEIKRKRMGKKPGWYLNDEFIGASGAEAKKWIANLPNPNAPQPKAKEPVDARMTEQEGPEQPDPDENELDEFGNPVHCNFGVR